jgi:hypothetical protein
VLAICNGAFREFVLVPRVGSATGHIISCFTFSAAILAATYASIRWLRVDSALRAIEIGAIWLVMTVLFEFGFGRVRGVEWNVLLADYNVFNGRRWALVLVTTFLAPLLTARARGMIGSPVAQP